LADFFLRARRFRAFLAILVSSMSRGPGAVRTRRAGRPRADHRGSPVPPMLGDTVTGHCGEVRRGPGS
jgi:hypothetical protein